MVDIYTHCVYYIDIENNTPETPTTKEITKMKAAKYLIATDHTAGHNNGDAYIRLDATKLLDAMTEASKILADDGHLYCSTLYQLVPGTKGTKYIPVARNYGHGGFYAAGAGSWDHNHQLIRTDFRTFEVYALQMI